MTAWSILIENSIAISGSTAWTHLNNQAGGGPVIDAGALLSAENYGTIQTESSAATKTASVDALIANNKTVTLSANLTQRRTE